MVETDIAPELIEKVNKEFEENLSKDKRASNLQKKLSEGRADYADAYDYAETIGTARAKAFGSEISSDVLPDGKMYYNIASRLMGDSLSTDHKLVTDYAAAVQKAYNSKLGIHLKEQRADLDEGRIKGFADRLSSEENFDDAAWLLYEPVVTHARSVVDDTIKKNAEFQHKAGIKAVINRKAAARCCDWCTDLEGDYTYPSVPREVFQRHDHCKCALDYNGKRLKAYESKNGAHSFRDPEEKERIDERKRLAIEKEMQNGIMKANKTTERAKSGKMHNEKYGDSAVFINKKYIGSDEYIGKYIGITGDEKVDNIIAQKAQTILYDRTGTFNETLVLFDKATGDEILTIAVDDDKQRIKYTASDNEIIKAAKEEGKEIIALHNHPTGWPPTADDCVTAHDKGYGLGITCGHNGSVNIYYPSRVSFTDDECRQIHNIIAEQSEYEKDINKVLRIWEDTLAEFDMIIKERR